MREIKFRAWDKFNDQMWYQKDSIGLFFTNMEEAQKGGNGIEFMQFTGLRDREGTEIYEDDILQGRSANFFSKGRLDNYKVMWGIDSWHISGTNFSLQELFNHCNNNVKVIGNIYQEEFKHIAK